MNPTRAGAAPTTRLALGLACLLGIPAPAAAQDSLPPWEGGLTASLGQPPRWRMAGFGSIGGDARAGGREPNILAGLAVSRPLLNPALGLLEVTAEVFAGPRGDSLDAGGRLLLTSQFLRLSAGLEVQGVDPALRGFLGFLAPVRRGGIFGGGTMLRLEWAFGDGNALRASVLAPLRQPWAGRTRPRDDRVAPPDRSAEPLPAPPGNRELLAELRRADSLAGRILTLVVPPLDVGGRDASAGIARLAAEVRRAGGQPAGGSVGVDSVVLAWHAALDRVFTLAVDPGAHEAVSGAGVAVAALARRVLLDRILLPYDRLLGQRRTRSSLGGFAAHARGAFYRGLSGEHLPPEADERALFAFQEVTRTLDRLRAAALEAWGDPRVIWLPLQLGLRPAEHDTQAELDALVERAVGLDFTAGNEVLYLVNREFQQEVRRSIRDTREYHVLWIHDFRGINAAGDPDLESMGYVVDAYLRALTDAVRRYGREGRVPTFMIFLDQHYYERQRGRLWLDVLERPLQRGFALPAGYPGLQARIDSALGELREAVAASVRLRTEARQYGEAWLDNLVKVHVSVTHPFDPSFRSRQLLPVLGLPDVVIRDHRKIVFWDVSEAEPWAGAAIYTGMGIGEHYGGPVWEDRSIKVRGPALIALREQARQLLRGQGMPADRIPWALRARRVTRPPIPPTGADQRALELHNGPGYQYKPINVAKAVLYTLIPPGAVVKVPDSLWESSLYAALLAGAALRGVRVLVVAPALRTAPSAGWLQMSATHDVLSRLILFRGLLSEEIGGSGGVLGVGLYNPGMGVGDVAARFHAAYVNARQTPFLVRLLPVDRMLDSLLVHLVDSLPPLPAAPAGVAEAPKLHLKANFFATREGWNDLVRRPEAVGVLRAYLRQLSRSGPEALVPVEELADSLSRASESLVQGFRASLDPATRERVAYWMIVGSPNQDDRSMFFDGEAAVLLSGWSGIIGLIDFTLIATLSTWVEDLGQLDALLPPAGGLRWRIARWARPLL